MTPRKFLLLALAIAALMAAALPAFPQDIEKAALPIEVAPMAFSVAPGGEAALRVNIGGREGWKLNSEPPPEFSFLGTPWLEAGKASMKGETKWSETLQSDYYTGDVEMTQTLRAAPSTPAGTHRVKAEFSYFPCDEKSGVCYRLTKEFTFDVTVGGEAQGMGFLARVQAALEGRGTLPLPLMLVGVFLLGLLTSFTPCIYPMIPITVGYFGSRAGRSRSKTLVSVAAYMLGIAVVYTAFGVAAAVGGAAFGSLTQKPLVLAGVGAVLFAMALSMMGFFDITFAAPAAAAKPREGLFGAAGMGAMAGLVASPCVTPVLVLLLTFVAAQGNLVLGSTLLFVFALGLGSLLGALAVFSSSSTSLLPKAGAWMVGVKIFMGIVLLGVAVYYFGQMTLVLGLGWWTGGAVSAGVGLMFLGYALDGLVFSPPESQGERMKRAVGFVCVALGVVLAMQGLGGGGAASAPGAAAQAEYDGVRWDKSGDVDAALARAKAEGKPVLVDFWAIWCTFCIEMDKTTFRDADVKTLAETAFVAVKVDADRAPETVKRYDVKGLPTILLLAPDGTELKRLAAYTDAATMLREMRAALIQAEAGADGKGETAFDWVTP